ncbi:MAG: N-acetylmuramoyl-L-alanine amidase [Vicinamibacterales bacterium]
MTTPLSRTVIAAVVAGVCLAAAPAAAQSARDRYESARALDSAARALVTRAADDGPPAAREQAIAAAARAITRYEGVVRRFPSSGYSDNALYQAADLAAAVYAAYGRVTHRTQVATYVRWLTREYPASSLRSKARGVLQQVERERAQRMAARTEPRGAAPPAPAPAAPAAAEEAVAPMPAGALAGPSATAPLAVRPGGAPSLQAIERAVLPDVVRLTLPLEREVLFTHQTLANPPRAFIDLHGVTAAPSLLETAVTVDDSVRQVRVGRQPDATRVVLDLAGPTRVSVFALYNPFRVVIDTERGPGQVMRVPVAAEAPVLLVDETAAPASSPSPVPAAEPAAGGPVPTAAAETRPPAPSAPMAVPGAAATAPPATVDPVVAVADGAAAPPPAVPAANTDGTFSLARQLGLGVSRIVIDPGHGGHDPGTRAHGATEAAIVLDVALRLERLLKKEPGLDVVLTRRTDVFIPLEQRTAIANRESADLFLSIHANASRNPSARGVETYFLSFASSPDAESVAARENATSDRAMHNLPGIVRAIALNTKLDESRDLAGMVQDAMTTRLAGANSGLRSRGVKKAPFVVLIGAGMPSVLAEVAFLTNRPEASLVKTPAYRQRIAEALHAAVLRYRRALKRQTAVAAR